MIESDETEDSSTTNDQYVKEQLADPFCTEEITTDIDNSPKTNDGESIVDVFLPKHKTQQSFAIQAIRDRNLAN